MPSAYLSKRASRSFKQNADTSQVWGGTVRHAHDKSYIYTFATGVVHTAAKERALVPWAALSIIGRLQPCLAAKFHVESFEKYAFASLRDERRRSPLQCENIESTSTHPLHFLDRLCYKREREFRSWVWFWCKRKGDVFLRFPFLVLIVPTGHFLRDGEVKLKKAPWDISISGSVFDWSFFGEK